MQLPPKWAGFALRRTCAAYVRMMTIASAPEARLPVDSDQFVLAAYHRDGVRFVPLGDGASVVVGRAPQADLVINDTTLSREHARFGREAHRLWVEDLGSTNGTAIGGQAVRRQDISVGDTVHLGSVRLCIYLLAEPSGLSHGLEAHDRFLSRLDEEVVRARTFGAGFAVMLVRAPRGPDTHIGSWFPRLRQRLRPVDRVALYGPETVEVLLAQTSLAELQRLMATIVEITNESPRLFCGAALFPAHATRADKLIELASDLVQRADEDCPVMLAEDRTCGVADPSGPRAPTVVSASMREVYRQVDRLSRSEIPVLIWGETGTGKELVAQQIHRRGPRGKLPLRCVNCGAIPSNLTESVLFGHERGAFTGADRRQKGVFEDADGATVLLDEIGELPLGAQVALLRVLETKRLTRVGATTEIAVNVRILAATHRDLESMCESGAFRWDLLYRLNTMTVRLPPLRERCEEILPLAERFVEEANQSNACSVSGLSPEVRDLLVAYRWPGNIRQLRNVVQRAVVLAESGLVSVDELPERLREGAESTLVGMPVRSGTARARPTVPVRGLRPVQTDLDAELDFRERIRRYEAELIHSALVESNWNQSRAARELRIPRRTLVQKIRDYGIAKQDEDP